MHLKEEKWTGLEPGGNWQQTEGLEVENVRQTCTALIGLNSCNLYNIIFKDLILFFCLFDVTVSETFFTLTSPLTSTRLYVNSN